MEYRLIQSNKQKQYEKPFSDMINLRKEKGTLKEMQ